MTDRTKRLLVAGGLALAVVLWVGNRPAHADEHEAKCAGSKCSTHNDDGHAHADVKEDTKDEHEHGGAGEKKESVEQAGHEQGHEAEEGTIELSPDAMKQLGLRVLAVESAKLNVTLSLTGKLIPHEDRVAHVIPRFSGVIREVRKRLGDSVAKGESVAVVENNQTLQPFEVKSQIPGIVVRRHATLGETVSDSSTLFEVADYRELFADFFVFPKEFKQVHLGQRVLIRFPDEQGTVESSISFISPVTDTDTQSRVVRAVLPNPAGAYQAGTFVNGDIVIEETTVAVAVEETALRTSEGKTVVFVEEEQGHFEVRPVLVGRKDKDRVEILKGLAAGERYAAGNTFILQAELEKGEAEHAH
jgi:cobalt-zinc-cadmium efflux system membrane fusion protein